MQKFNSTFKQKATKPMKTTALKRTGFKNKSYAEIIKAKQRSKPKAKKKRSQALTDHFNAVIALGVHPSLHGEGRLTIHHCHSGSMSDNGFYRGISQKPSDWLVIALPESLHTGAQGIDSGMGVRDWEAKYCDQYAALEWVSEQLEINVFDLAKKDKK